MQCMNSCTALIISDVERAKCKSFTVAFPSRGANIGSKSRGSAASKYERSEFRLITRGRAPRNLYSAIISPICAPPKNRFFGGKEEGADTSVENDASEKQA